MKLRWTILALCCCIPAQSMAASDLVPVPTPTLTEQDPTAFHAFERFALKDRHRITPMSDQELREIKGQGTIDISILVFSGSVASVDFLMVNPGPPNVGVIQVVPPSPCRDVC